MAKARVNIDRTAAVGGVEADPATVAALGLPPSPPVAMSSAPSFADPEGPPIEGPVASAAEMREQQRVLLESQARLREGYMSMPSPTQAEVQADLDRQRAIMYGPIALTQSPIAPAAPQPRPEPPKPQFMSPEMQRAIYGRQSITSLDHPAPHTPHPTPHETLVTGRGMPPSIPREGASAGCLAGLRLLERLLAGGLINPSALTVRGEAMACVDAMKKELCE